MSGSCKCDKFKNKNSSDPRKRKPGATINNEYLKLPGQVAPGKYAVQIGLVKPDTSEAAINLSNEGKTGDGWCQFGGLEIM